MGGGSKTQTTTTDTKSEPWAPAQPALQSILSGVPALLQNSGTENFGYQQGFPTGTLLNVSCNNSRVTTNSTRTFLVPQLNSNFLIQLRQHLLEGLGLSSNRRFIAIARNNREIADEAFRQQVIFTVTQIETLYWNLVTAYEDQKAKERVLASAQQLESNNRKQVQAGTIAQIEIVNAQAQVASSQQALITSQTNLQLQQLLIKNAITRNENDPVLVNAGVVPVDRMQLPPSEPVLPTQDLVNEALQRRPSPVEAPRAPSCNSSPGTEKWRCPSSRPPGCGSPTTASFLSPYPRSSRRIPTSSLE